MNDKNIGELKFLSPPPFIEIILICLYLKAFHSNVVGSGGTFWGNNTTKWTRFTGFLHMIELTFQPFQQSKGMGRPKEWFIRTSRLPEKLRFLWGKKPYITKVVPKEYQASYDRAKAWMSTPEFAVWKNEIFSKLGKFDATLQKAEEFLDALYKVYNPVGLDSDNPKEWRVEQSKKKWNKCDDVNLDYCTTNNFKRELNDDLDKLRSYDKNPEEYEKIITKLRFLMTRFSYGLGEQEPPNLERLRGKILRELSRGRGLMSPPLKKQYEVMNLRAGLKVEQVADVTGVSVKDLKALNKDNDDTKKGTWRVKENEPVAKEIQDDILWEIEEEEAQLEAESIPFYDKWAKVGLVDNMMDRLTRDGKIYDTKSRDDIEAWRQSLYKAYGITKHDVFRYNEIRKAWREFEDEDLAKRKGYASAGVRFSEAKEKWKSFYKDNLRASTMRQYEVGQADFIECCGDVDVARISKDRLTEFLKWLHAEYHTLPPRDLAKDGKSKGKLRNSGRQLNHATILNKVTGVNVVIDYCIEHETSIPISTNEWYKHNKDVYGQAERKRGAWSDEQLNKLFRYPMPPHLRLIFQIGFCTGCRLEEVASLQWRDIRKHQGIPSFHFDRKDLFVKESKSMGNAVRRITPIADDLLIEINNYAKNFSKEDLAEDSKVELFPMFGINDVGKKSNSASARLQTIYSKVRPSDSALKLDFHSFRNTLEDLLEDQKAPNSMIRKIVGHEQFGMDRRYNWQSPRNHKNVLKLLNDVGFGKYWGE